MTHTTQLDSFLDSLEGLQSELRRNMMLLADLDERSHTLQQSVEHGSDEYVSRAPEMTEETRRSALQHIDSQLLRMREFADDKVQLAIQTYELVDKHVRRLDAELSCFQTDLRQRGVIAPATPSAAVVNSNGARRGGCVSGAVRSTGPDLKQARARKRARQSSKSSATPAQNAGATEEQFSAEMVQTSDVLDMPVDPNEPTYCVCQQVSYGKMIGCDNLDCPIEWFHFSCVGLVDKPKGKWFCSKCSVASGNDKKR